MPESPQHSSIDLQPRHVNERAEDHREGTSCDTRKRTQLDRDRAPLAVGSAAHTFPRVPCKSRTGEPTHRLSRGSPGQQTPSRMPQLRHCSHQCLRILGAFSSISPIFGLKSFWSDWQTLNFSQRRPSRANTMWGVGVLWGGRFSLYCFVLLFPAQGLQ